MAENSSCSSASSCSRESCEGCPSKAKGGNGIAKEPMNPSSNVKKVIGVVSGKGGVGKSSGRHVPLPLPHCLNLNAHGQCDRR